MANLFDIFSKTADQAIGDIDLSPGMIYLFDVVNQNAFPFIASQLDVEGFKGWDLATTEEQKRELLKTAIQIKKHLGTPYSIKQALKAIGFDQVTIQEGINNQGNIYYDGTYLYNGLMMYGGFNWASFTVTIKTKYLVPVSDETKALIRELILYYKNARSYLVDVIYQVDNTYYYDGTLKFDATINYL